MRQTFNVDKFEDWKTVAHALVTYLQTHPDVKHVLLEGNLGAGKTTLVQHAVKQFGSNDTVQSPTFSLINRYETATHQGIYHLDLYRLKSQSELVEAGVLDALDSGFLCFVEWPALAKPFLDNDVVNVDIVLTENGVRSITLYRQ